MDEHPLRAQLRTITVLKEGPVRFVADMLDWSGRCVTQLEDAEKEWDRRPPAPDPDAFERLIPAGLRLDDVMRELLKGREDPS
jgi:hypothetical protein